MLDKPHPIIYIDSETTITTNKDVQMNRAQRRKFDKDLNRKNNYGNPIGEGKGNLKKKRK